MNIYDSVHELAKTLQQSQEYRKYVEAKEKLQQDEKKVNELQEFRRQQLEIQIAELSGEDVEREVEQAEKVYQILSLDPNINEFLTAEYRLSRMVANIQKILGDALDIDIEFGSDKTHLN